MFTIGNLIFKPKCRVNGSIFVSKLNSEVGQEHDLNRL